MHGYTVTSNNNYELILNKQSNYEKGMGMGSILQEEKGQWWGNTGCIINCKSSIWAGQTLFLTSFLRCHQNIANLPGYFGHAWANP